jgi:predicted molibdopterin-dependent oxidoreductase YjgC
LFASSLRPIRGSLGISLPDWEIFASLALACGGDLGFETLDELHDEMGRLLAPRTIEPAAFDPASGSPVVDAGVRLFTYPLLVDEGRLSERADELKAALEATAFAEIDPRDAEAAGVVDGGPVIVRTDAGEAEVTARVTEHVAPGVVFVPFYQPGLAANALLSGELVTGVTLEAVVASEDAEPEAVAVGGDAS